MSWFPLPFRRFDGGLGPCSRRIGTRADHLKFRGRLPSTTVVASRRRRRRFVQRKTETLAFVRTAKELCGSDKLKTVSSKFAQTGQANRVQYKLTISQNSVSQFAILKSYDYFNWKICFSKVNSESTILHDASTDSKGSAYIPSFPIPTYKSPGSVPSTIIHLLKPYRSLLSFYIAIR